MKLDDAILKALRDYYSFRHQYRRGVRRPLPANVWNDVIFEFSGEEKDMLENDLQWLQSYEYDPSASVLRLLNPDGSLGSPVHVPFGEVSFGAKFGAKPQSGSHEGFGFGTLGDWAYIILHTTTDGRFILDIRNEPYGYRFVDVPWSDSYISEIHDFRIQWWPCKVVLLIDESKVAEIDDFPIPPYALELYAYNNDSTSLGTTKLELDWISYHPYVNPRCLEKDYWLAYNGTINANETIFPFERNGYGKLKFISLRTGGYEDAQYIKLIVEVDGECVVERGLNEFARNIWDDHVNFIDVVRHAWDTTNNHYGFAIRCEVESEYNIKVGIENPTSTDGITYDMLIRWARVK